MVIAIEKTKGQKPVEPIPGTCFILVCSICGMPESKHDYSVCKKSNFIPKPRKGGLL